MNFSKNIFSILKFKTLKNFERNLKSSYYKKNYRNKKEIGPVGWTLLAVPVTTFALGTWQVKRKIWKEGLIADMMSKTNNEPVSLIENLDNLHELDYKPVFAKGHYLHDKELYMGPRSLLVRGDASTEGGLISQKGSSTQGYLVITPFKLENQDKTILVNRGWVPTKKKNPLARTEGQIEADVNIVGIVRSQENRPTFLPKNDVKANQWYYRDIQTMAKVTEADPIFLDLTDDCNVPGGPLGGQTRVTLRNEHLSYIITWYGLSAFTGCLWYLRFIKNVNFR